MNSGWLDNKRGLIQWQQDLFNCKPDSSVGGSGRGHSPVREQKREHMTLASNSAKDRSNKFGKAIHNLKRACTTYSAFSSSEQTCKHLMIVNSLSEEKIQSCLDSLLG